MDTDTLKIIGSVLLGVGLFFALLLYGAYHLDRQTCYVAWEDFAPEYSVFGGCRVTFNGKRVPTATLRKVDLED